MLTLEKSDHATVVVSMFRKGSETSKRPPQTVYFSHNVSAENENTAEAAAVLDLHRTFLKKKNQINEEDFKEICDLIDDDAEPDQHDYLRPTLTATCSARCGSATTRTWSSGSSFPAKKTTGVVDDGQRGTEF